jgi:hypothetical protein
MRLQALGHLGKDVTFKQGAQLRFGAKLSLVSCQIGAKHLLTTVTSLKPDEYQTTARSRSTVHFPATRSAMIRAIVSGA